MNRTNLNRRDFCAIAGTTVTSIMISSACNSLIGNDGRLNARPRQSVTTMNPGRITLGLDRDRDAILDLPKRGGAIRVPLFVMLHGATQSAEDMFWYLGSAHEEAGIAVLAPNSRDTTWDAIGGRFGFGPYVEFLNRALERTFEVAPIDPARVSVGGFSDGASYAVSLGLINGDFFNSVVAFSPGFIVEGPVQGKPRFYISHGTNDHILPIDRCGRRIARLLKSGGYDVTFREFEGDHEVPAEVMREGLARVTASAG